jgi:hypothetical protein
LKFISFAEIDCLPVDDDFHAAEHLQLEPGRRDDDVGRELAARPQLDPALGEGFDLVGDDISLAALDRVKKVRIRSQAHALVPWIVARGRSGF